MCGQCCHGYGGTYVAAEDIEAISAYIGMDPRCFVVEHCRLSGDKLLLAQREDGRCVFWDGLCRIHPVKPRMCRVWPFIPALLVDVGNWRAMASVCPGMRTDLPDEQILAGVRRVLGACCGRRTGGGA
jgi:hypothetical protein